VRWGHLEAQLEQVARIRGASQSGIGGGAGPDMSLRLDRLWPAEDITCDLQPISAVRQGTLRHPAAPLLALPLK